MKYPTLEEVEAADHRQICQWCRNLPLPYTIKWAKKKIPSMELIGVEAATKIFDRIYERFIIGGGPQSREWEESYEQEVGTVSKEPIR